MPDFHRTIAPDPRQVAGVTSAFAAFVEAHKVRPAVRRSVSVALDELLSNCLAHGRGDELVIEVKVRADRLVITVSDNGNPFNPLEMAAPDTTRSVTDREIGGLGIHLARQLMDEVVYQRRGDCNVVTLTKLLP